MTGVQYVNKNCQSKKLTHIVLLYVVDESESEFVIGHSSQYVYFFWCLQLLLLRKISRVLDVIR